MEFIKTNLYSKKLERDVTVETYETKEHIIVSTNSLKKLFESVKNELGIKDTVTSNVVFTDKGLFLHASAKWHVEDKFGYCSEFIGEATPASLDTLIAKRFPETTALNRAQSAGIIAYLQLPKKMYSDAQISPVVGETEKPRTAAEILEDALNRKAKHPEQAIMPTTIEATECEKVDEPKKGVVQDAPEMTTETELPYAGADTDAAKTEPVTVDEKAEIAEPTNTDTDATVDENTKFGLSSVFGDKTIKEVLEQYRNGDKQTIGFMKLIISGTFVPQTVEAKEVIDFVKAKL